MTTRPAGAEPALATVNQAAAYPSDSGRLPFILVRSHRRIRWPDLRHLVGEDGGVER